MRLGEKVGTGRESASVGIREELQRSQAVDSVPLGLALTDASGRIEWSNRWLQEHLRLGRSTLRGESASVVAGPYAMEAEGLQVLELIRQGSGSLELTAFSRDGLSFLCQVRVQAVSDSVLPGGRLVTLIDLTERQQLQAELLLNAEAARREHEILRATAQSLEDGLLVADDADRVVLCNDAACELFGLPAAAHGRSVREMEIPTAVRGAWLAFVASGRGESVQTARVSFGGGPARMLLLRFVRARAAHGAPIASVLIARDLSRLAERNRREIALADETPLACRPADVAQLVRDALVAFASGAGSDVPVEADLPLRAVPASVDAGAFGRLVAELLDNAARHGNSPRGVRVSLAAGDGLVRLSVRDWGPGLAPDRLESVFDPLPPGAAEPRTAGLALCRRVASGHGGSVWAELPADGGLRIVAELPR
ncbi:MAG: PAS domain-containing protein [Acidobacteria bacterium]|nr:PAS domain-containing protein [Acidobacteriota bacterium]